LLKVANLNDFCGSEGYEFKSCPARQLISEVQADSSLSNYLLKVANLNDFCGSEGYEFKSCPARQLISEVQENDILNPFSFLQRIYSTQNERRKIIGFAMRIALTACAK